MKSFQRFDKEQKHTLDSLLQFCHDVIRSCSNHSQKHADTLSRSYIIPTHHAIHHAITPCTMHRSGRARHRLRFVFVTRHTLGPTLLTCWTNLEHESSKYLGNPIPATHHVSGYIRIHRCTYSFVMYICLCRALPLYIICI